MINVEQFVQYVIRPTLIEMGKYSESAENLLIGTAVQESKLEYLHQINGPAISIYQIEPNTYNDMWANYINHRSELSTLLRQIAGYKYRTTNIPAREMYGNLFYATAMCRVHYLRVKQSLPQHDDLEKIGVYYKKYYNTKSGKATVAQFLENYYKYVIK